MVYRRLTDSIISCKQVPLICNYCALATRKVMSIYNHLLLERTQFFPQLIDFNIPLAFYQLLLLELLQLPVNRIQLLSVGCVLLHQL